MVLICYGYFRFNFPHWSISFFLLPINKNTPGIPSISHPVIKPFNEFLLGSLLLFGLWPVATAAAVTDCLSYTHVFVTQMLPIMRFLPVIIIPICQYYNFICLNRVVLCSVSIYFSVITKSTNLILFNMCTNVHAQAQAHTHKIRTLAYSIRGSSQKL